MRVSPVRASRILAKLGRIFSVPEDPEVRTTGAPDARPVLTPEEFQQELAYLGLSAVEFRPGAYRKALEPILEIRITARVFPEHLKPGLARAMAREGRVALVSYDKEEKAATILVPGSLPPLARLLALNHELAHLASGDLGTPRRLAKHPSLPHGPKCDPDEKPCPPECPREQEAELRAYYMTVAGTLGPLNPYAERMFDTL